MYCKCKLYDPFKSSDINYILRQGCVSIPEQTYRKEIPLIWK